MERKKPSFFGMNFLLLICFQTVCALSNNTEMLLRVLTMLLNATVPNFSFKTEFPALQFPKLDPYTPAYPWLIRTLDTYLPVNFDGNWTNITIYGMDKAVFEHIKYVWLKSFI